ncbi:Uncharacterised protein [Mycobacteroides abscessus subsp. abscessus]|nr:Uncharacterised protein [Mycobacteroides abscessus subsp. abscessus]
MPLGRRSRPCTTAATPGIWTRTGTPSMTIPCPHYVPASRTGRHVSDQCLTSVHRVFGAISTMEDTSQRG